MMTSTPANRNSQIRCVMFSGGGSGGHLFPGIAVAEELIAGSPDCQILFLTGDRPVDLQLNRLTGIPSPSLTVKHLTVPALRDAWKRPWRFFPRMIGSMIRAIRFVRTNRPQCIVGLGGIASVPGVLAGALFRTPVMLLEQNTTPGAATCWLSRFADVICEGLPLKHRAGIFRRTRIVPTGIPLRREFTPTASASPLPITQHRRQLLILGGSQGASGLNLLVISAIRQIAASRGVTGIREWRIIHQAGERDRQFLTDAYRELGLDALVTAFIDEPCRAMRESQLIISRAGAVTIAELLATGSTVILVPMSNLARDHQTENARWYSQQTGQVWLEEKGDNAVVKLAEQVELQMSATRVNNESGVCSRENGENPMIQAEISGASVVREIAGLIEEI